MAEKKDMKSSLPAWIKQSGEQTVYFIEFKGKDVDLGDKNTIGRLSGLLEETQAKAFPGKVSGQGIIKTHIGEPLVTTSIIPKLAESSVHFLKSKGASGVAIGDTTVLYSSRRGGRENPTGNEKQYLGLAKEKGWTDLSAPFVIFDRPATSVKGSFVFDEGAITVPMAPPSKYKEIYLAGALAKADCLVQHAHMTGHLLTGLACCVKGLSMGFANRRGKAHMHLSLRPSFSDEICTRCGNCVETCPEDALEIKNGNAPALDEGRCVGCGQCVSVCEDKAVAMKGIENYQGYDWSRGGDSIHARTADYAIGAMNNLWESSVHVAHLVRMTPSCDCWNAKQTPICDDIGFLVGRNPFAVDCAAIDLLIGKVSRFADEEMQSKIDAIRKSNPGDYVAKTWGIAVEPAIEKISFA